MGNLFSPEDEPDRDAATAKGGGPEGPADPAGPADGLDVEAGGAESEPGNPPCPAGEGDAPAEPGAPPDDAAGDPGEDALEDAAALPEPGVEAALIGKITEALLFAADKPLAASRIAAIIGCGTRGAHVRKAAAALNEAYERGGASFRVAEIAGGLQALTLPEFDEWIARLRSEERSARLSEAALDILAVVAYKQPILKAEINHIRGVESGPLLRTLIDKNLVRIAGRADQPGRPLLYGTTKKFLEVFGLKSLGDLPKADKLS